MSEILESIRSSVGNLNELSSLIPLIRSLPKLIISGILLLICLIFMMILIYKVLLYIKIDPIIVMTIFIVILSAAIIGIIIYNG